MSNYRKIYENSFGKISKDDTGRVYEIHHIDGNNKNNDISNLKCVSIQDHYNIHFEQGDYMACLMIASRMTVSPHELSFLAKQQVVSEKTKDKLRQANKIQFDNPALRERHRQACIDKNANHKNTIWINNSVKNKRIYIEELDEYLISGYTKGRLLGDIKFYKHGNRNRNLDNGQYTNTKKGK